MWGGASSAKKSRYSHQLVGMGRLKHLSKEGIWQRATRVLSFTNSSPPRDDNAPSRLHPPLCGDGIPQRRSH